MKDDIYNGPISEASDEVLLDLYFDSEMRDRMDMNQPLLGELAKRLKRALDEIEAWKSDLEQKD